MLKTINLQELKNLLKQALIAHHTSEKNAEFVADALLQAEIDGQIGHGLCRLEMYCQQSLVGKVNGNAEVEVSKITEIFYALNANYGFAYPALQKATELLTTSCQKYGLSMTTITHSHHMGVAGLTVEKLAKNGLIGLVFANTPKAIAPWGGNKAIFGTNPIAFASPRKNKDPLVIDLSLSKVARGKVMLSQKNKEDIPLGWALDKEGNPTTSADEAMAGTMLPTGDAKGYALVLMVEILSAVLTNATLSAHSSSLFDIEGKPPDLGQLLIAIDPKIVSGDDYLDRLEDLMAIILSQDNTRLPGTKRIKNRALVAKNGLAIKPEMYQKIKRLTQRF